MKQLISLISISLLLVGCESSSMDTTPPEVAAETNAQGFCDDLSGSWEMVFRTVTTADSIYTQDRSNVPTLKILNDTHWMFVRNTNEGDFVLARGGPYTLVDGKYTEIVGYSSVPGNVGTKYVFDCEVVDDSWYHKGPVGDELVDEIWQRVKTENETM